jgi:Leucine-rich repeat (LRR) protein
MKKFYFLFIGLCLFENVTAQIIYIPDSAFKSKLISANQDNFTAKDLLDNYTKIDVNGDGEIQSTEALNISSISVAGNSNIQINDLMGIEQFSNLRYFYCSDADIPDLNLSGLSNLIEIKYIRNKTNTINLSGLTKLEKLNIWTNNIVNIDFSGLSNIKSLEYSSNKITLIDLTGLPNLEILNCSSNGIANLDIPLLPNLKELYCDNNTISSLDLSGVNNLEILDCNSNDLSILNSSNLTNLKSLSFKFNKITEIDVVNAKKLEFLGCSYNLLSTLDVSGIISLSRLDCATNNLTSVNVSDCINLGVFDCSENELTTIDLADCGKLSTFNCSFNLLSSLFLKNGSANNYYHYISSNPTLKYICVDENEKLYYKGIVNNLGYKDCEVNSYCSFTGGANIKIIQGINTFDVDNNGCDSNDRIYPNLNFSISDGTMNENIISNTSGNYSVFVGEGTHTIVPIIENPNYFSVSPVSANVTFPIQTSPFIQDFCVTPNGVHNDLEVTILPLVPARPGFDATYKIIYKNNGTTMQSGSVVLTFNDEVLDFVSATPNFNNQITNKLTWNYSYLRSFESREINITLNVNSPMETPAVNIGDRLSFNALISPVSGDEKPVDNSFALRQSVVGSFDPNDKTCLEGDVLTPELIGEYVHYLIRFENTGTYPAQNIVVKDLIDLSKFDISTLTPMKASHDFVIKISEDNTVEFIFENINLPFDDATNDGYIAFKIKTVPTLVTGDSFTNEANIYFDYNFPILTNKATSTFKTLGTQDFEFSDYFSVYPNPVSDILNIGTKNTIQLKTMAIYDVLGQIVLAVLNAQNISKVDVSKLSSGNYFLKINTDKGTSSFKFIKN